MAERLKAHAWKVCIPSGIVGSNPTLSAILKIDYFVITSRLIGIEKRPCLSLSALCFDTTRRLDNSESNILRVSGGKMNDA